MKLHWTSMVFLAGLMSSDAALGALSLTSVNNPYNQSFDTLATSGNSNMWTNNTSIPGWYWQTDYASSFYGGNIGNHANNAEMRYSYGSLAAPTDRAMGHYSDGNEGHDDRAAWGIVLKNDLGQEIVTLKVDYFGEQWRRNTSGGSDSLQFSYMVSSSDITDLVPGSGVAPGGWTAVSSLDFPALQSGANGSLDGNDAANRTQKVATINVSVPAGQYIALRWYDGSIAGGNNDSGMAIDNLIVTASVPEPGAVLFGVLVACAYALFSGYRRMVSRSRGPR